MLAYLWKNFTTELFYLRCVISVRWLITPWEVKLLGLLATAMFIVNYDQVVDFCTAATDETTRQRVGFTHDFSGYSDAARAYLQQLEQQLWLMANTLRVGHWGPSRDGLLLGAGSAALLLSLAALLRATRPVEAIFSFLALLLALLLPLLLLEADYVGAIHLMVYPGAILIFFSFATLTTDQQGHWGYHPNMVGGTVDNSPTLVELRKWLRWVPTLLVALPLLLLWWQQLSPRLSPSLRNRSGAESLLSSGYPEGLPLDWLRSSDLVALGLEIFQRRLLSLTLLGLLLLLAFLTALELLAPLQRRRSSQLFPRLGAAGLLGWLRVTERLRPLRSPHPRELTQRDLEQRLFCWNHYGGDAWLLPLLVALALGLGTLATQRLAFLHSFLLLEALGLLLNLFFVVVGVVSDDLGGAVLVLFSVAVAAAETAVGLALFLTLSQGNAPVAPNRPPLGTRRSLRRCLRPTAKRRRDPQVFSVYRYWW